jgi:hypothetical protein
MDCVLRVRRVVRWSSDRSVKRASRVGEVRVEVWVELELSSKQARLPDRQAGSKVQSARVAAASWRAVGLLSVHAVAVDKVVSFARFRASDEGRFLADGRSLCASEMFRGSSSPTPLAQTANSGLDGLVEDDGARLNGQTVINGR